MNWYDNPVVRRLHGMPPLTPKHRADVPPDSPPTTGAPSCYVGQRQRFQHGGRR